MTAPRVLVADHPGVFRSGVVSLLLQDARYDVVEVDDADALVAAAQSQRPDVVLVDSRFASAEELHRALPVVGSGGAAVIVWGFDVPPSAAVAAIQAGADGFLHKDISPEGLLRAIEAALGGEAVLPRDVVRPMVESLRHLDERYRARELVMSLSPRERQVLALIAAGARNRTIALSLDISEFTVKRHVQNILRKLDLPSRKVAAVLHLSATADSPPVRLAVHPNQAPRQGPAPVPEPVTARA